jgi:thiol-disulfide isomerase/thioredoxin
MPDSTTRPDRSWLYIAAAFLAFWVAYLAFFAPGRRQPLQGSAIDLPADYEWTLQDLNEQPVKFSRFKGKTVFLNIWATWCGPCIGEMPSIARLASDPRLKAKNIEFVCVSTDDSVETVRRFISEKGWPMTVLHSQSLPPVFLTDGIPATFIISPSGQIVAAEVGSNKWDSPKVVEFLEKAANAPAVPSAAAPVHDPSDPKS